MRTSSTSSTQKSRKSKLPTGCTVQMSGAHTSLAHGKVGRRQFNVLHARRRHVRAVASLIIPKRLASPTSLSRRRWSSGSHTAGSAVQRAARSSSATWPAHTLRAGVARTGVTDAGGILGPASATYMLRCLGGSCAGCSSPNKLTQVVSYHPSIPNSFPTNLGRILCVLNASMHCFS